MYGWGGAPILVALAVMVFCILASIICYLAIERPARNWLRGVGTSVPP
jgi:peptidoglycan/LPS O-acetylase OafA/YrhL